MISERTSPSALTFSDLLGRGPMARVALEAAMAGLDSPAFIVSSRGTVLVSNPPGQKRAARSSDGMRGKLAKIVAGDHGADVLVTPLKVENKQPYFLVVFRPPSSLEERVAYASRLWDLTERQSEVLGLVAAGFANKTIASRLACTERNVEAHLTAIYAKSGISGRTALVASLARHAG